MPEQTFPPRDPKWPPVHSTDQGVTSYKVKKIGPMGESFVDICRTFGIKFEDLVEFNFGLKRSEPHFFEKINWFLKNKLACVRTTADGNFIFSGGETIYIPPRGFKFDDVKIVVPDGTVIEGNAAYIPQAEFRTKIQKCLNMLRTKAPQYYIWFKKYNLKLRAARASGANFDDGAIDIARATFDSTETWLASVIIHESIHFWQYRDGHYHAGTEAETEANRYQLGVLQLVGASQSEISYMMSQDGGHADRNGDGVYDWKDYEDRNY